MARRSRSPRRSRPATQRQYPRTARLNALLQQVVAEFFEDVEDERLGLLTITGVEVDSDLNKAQVYISNLDDQGDIKADEQRDAEILEALAEYRREVQADIAQNVRIRKTPEVVFGFDPAVRAGARIDEILSGLPSTQPDPDSTD